MKEKMSSKQEMARLTIASVAVLLAGLVTTPLMNGSASTSANNAVAQTKTPVLRKLGESKAQAAAKTHKPAKTRWVVADNRRR